MGKNFIWSDLYDQLVEIITLKQLDEYEKEYIIIYVGNEKNEHDKISIHFLVGATKIVIVEV